MTIAVLQRALGEHGPGEAGRRVGGGDLGGFDAAVEQRARRVFGQQGGFRSEQVAVRRHAAHPAPMTSAQFEKIRTGRGFLAALDQSGGSTPKALAHYGVPEDSWSGDTEMFDAVHAMRTRIITDPAFTGERVLGAILFEDTMDRQVEGRDTAGLPVGRQGRGAVPQGRQGPRGRGRRRAGDEAHRRPRRPPRPRRREGRLRHEDALGDQDGGRGGRRRDRRAAVHDRRADRRRRARADPGARGRHPQPPEGRSREAAARRDHSRTWTRCPRTGT